MGTIVRDGSGDNYAAQVSLSKELSVTTGNQWQKACLRGDAYYWASADADVNTGDTLILVKNKTEKRYLMIHGAFIMNGNVAATTYDFHVVTTGFTDTGTLLTGINMNANFGVTGDAIAWGDETGNTQGTVIFDHITTSAAVNELFTSDDVSAFPLLIPPGGAFGIDQITESDSGWAGVYGYFIDK